MATIIFRLPCPLVHLGLSGVCVMQCALPNPHEVLLPSACMPTYVLSVCGGKRICERRMFDILSGTVKL